MPKNPNAFPLNAGEHGYEPDFGMTLRDWFAGQVLALPFCEGDYIHRAKVAYEQADALLAERERQP